MAYIGPQREMSGVAGASPKCFVKINVPECTGLTQSATWVRHLRPSIIIIIKVMQLTALDWAHIRAHGWLRD